MVMGLCKVASSVFFILDELPLCHTFKYTPCLNINDNVAIQATRGLIHLNQFSSAASLCVVQCFKATVVCRRLFWFNVFSPWVNCPAEALVGGSGTDNIGPFYSIHTKNCSACTNFWVISFPISRHSPAIHCSPGSDFHQEWEMLINFNEIDIYINRSENTKGAYLFNSFQVPRCFTSQKKFITVTQSLLERLLPTPPPASSPHWLLLYVEEIETSVKLSLLHRTKESDIPEWRIPPVVWYLWISLHPYSICTKEILSVWAITDGCQIIVKTNMKCLMEDVGPPQLQSQSTGENIILYFQNIFHHLGFWW